MLTARSVAVDDGTTMTVHIAPPADVHDTPGPGLLLLQDAYGYNSYLQRVAERFAGLGLTVAVPELYHRTGNGVGLEYNDPAHPLETNRPHMRAMTSAGMVLDVQAAYACLASMNGVAPERIAALGFCHGGRLAFLANGHLPLRAAVSFYGNGITGDLLDRARTQSGRILMFWGGSDPRIPPDEYGAVATALTAAGKDHDQVFFSDADHGFFSPAAPAPIPARVAWAMVVEFFHATGVLA
jgi:carboxymethylenebutenolidase